MFNYSGDEKLKGVADKISSLVYELNSAGFNLKGIITDKKIGPNAIATPFGMVSITDRESINRSIILNIKDHLEKVDVLN